MTHPNTFKVTTRDSAIRYWYTIYFIARCAGHVDDIEYARGYHDFVNEVKPLAMFLTSAKYRQGYSDAEGDWE